MATSKNHPKAGTALAAAFVLAFCIAARATEFAGGTGEPDDPYQIATAEQLISIGRDLYLLDRHFVLVADIDLDPHISWEYAFRGPVIGGFERGDSRVAEFGGVFDGNGFTIRHLTIKPDPGEGYETLGLFYVIASKGEVRHLVLEDVSILTDSGSAGPICGSNRGRVIGCTVSGTVSTSSAAGGLVMSNDGLVSRCSVSGTVSAGNTAGGLVGSNRGLARVEESRSLCTVLGRESGGLIGDNRGEVWNCYASGDVFGEYAGGLVGTNGLQGLISHCYATGQVSGTGPYNGGLVGIQFSGAVTVQSYFLWGPDNGVGTWLTSDQMKDPASFVGWDFWGIGNNGFRVPWFMPEAGYPQLTWMALEAIPDVSGQPADEAHATIAAAGIGVAGITYDYDHMAMYGHVIGVRPCPEVEPGAAVDMVASLGAYDWTANPGTGRPSDPYLVVSAGQLDCLAHQRQLWDRHFRLIADLDMSWRVYEEALIGHSDSLGVAFDGVFDGDGHVIRGLTIEGGWVDENDTMTLGLFGRIGQAGAVRDLGLTNVSIAAPRNRQAMAGMLCVINEGDIDRCYGDGSVKGYGYLGGLVARNAGAIEDCYARGQVEDLACHEDIRPDGGLVAENTTGTILTCYATCFVKSCNAGGLVGYNESGLVEKSLWDAETSGAESSDGGTGLPRTQMKQQASFTSWDFANAWTICEGQDYPRLNWENMDCDP